MKTRSSTVTVHSSLNDTPASAWLRILLEKLCHELNSWHNVHKKLLWCNREPGRIIDFWIVFFNLIIVVRKLVREAWTHYHWETRPSCRP